MNEWDYSDLPRSPRFFSLLPGNGYDKALEESAVEEAGGIDKSPARTVVEAVFSKEREFRGSWWTSDWGGCVPRTEEAEATLRFLDGPGHSQERHPASPSGCGCTQRSYLGAG